MKKLQSLLNPEPLQQREQPKTASFGNQSFQYAPPEVFPSSTNNGILQFQNPSYKKLPLPQNIFYHPLSKGEENSYANSLAQFSHFQAPTNNNGLFTRQNNLSAEETVRNLILMASSELGSSPSSLDLVKLNASLSQPKTLNELLQKSVSTTNSNSLVQSPFMSTRPSPLVGYNNLHNSYIQNQLGPDFSNVLTSSVLGTPLQNSHQLRNQIIPPPQSNPNGNELFLKELTSLLNQDNGGAIRSILAEFVSNYNGGNSEPNRPLFAANGTPRMQDKFFHSLHQQKISEAPKTISLSNGFTMNSLNRTPDQSQGSFAQRFRPGNFNHLNMGQNKREMNLPNELSLKRGNYSIIPEEDSMDLGNLSFSQTKQPSLHDQSMGRKLGSVSLDNNVNRNDESKEVLNSKFLIGEELSLLFQERLSLDGEAPGIYDREERTDKILKYKNKIRKWRVVHPVNRNFKGRSVVAGKKPRIKGKFVTEEEYMDYINSKNPKEKYETDSLANQPTSYGGSEFDTQIKEEN